MPRARQDGLIVTYERVLSQWQRPWCQDTVSRHRRIENLVDN
jgi:hypothetical protein